MNQPFNLNKYIKEAGRKLAIHETLISSTLMEMGQGIVIVSRIKKNGDILMASFLVDMYCMGVKDIHMQLSTEEVYATTKDRMIGRTNQVFLSVSPNHAFNLIYGAVEFAEENGFTPIKDFATAEFILDDVESIAYEEIEFGKDGKPFYVSSSYGSDERNLRILEKTLGKGNFTYFIPE
ncbi:MAG: hypothetical protein WAT92_23210 [Saprospiraceae bacterium]